jgi:hypothetical protein
MSGAASRPGTSGAHADAALRMPDRLLPGFSVSWR